MALLNKVRLGLFVSAIISSVVALAIECLLIHYGGRSDPSIGLVASLLTLVLASAVLIMDKVRKGIISSRVWFELLWTGVLGILWVIRAALSTSVAIEVCQYRYYDPCSVYIILLTFSWLNCLMMLGWFVTVFILSFLTSSKGNDKIWVTSTTEALFLKPVTRNLFQPPSVTPISNGLLKPGTITISGESKIYNTTTQSTGDIVFQLPQYHSQQQHPLQSDARITSQANGSQQDPDTPPKQAQELPQEREHLLGGVTPSP